MKVCEKEKLKVKFVNEDINMKFLLKVNVLQRLLLQSFLLNRFIGRILWIGLCVLPFSSIEAETRAHPDEQKSVHSPHKENREESCNFISSQYKVKDGELSDYWAQELIGSDLLRKELKKAPAPEKRNYLSIFDTGKNSHDVAVKNLISGEELHSVLPEMKDQISIFDVTNFGDDLVVAEYLLENQEIPSFINNSMRWVESQSVYDAFDSLSPPSIVIVSSGNTELAFGSMDEMKSKASKDFNTIIVGSFSPAGLASDTSQSGEEVHILAPSDKYITSSKEDGSYSKFGGTSGAAPLVTGSLAGFEWLSGYHPTAEEAKILLEKTSLPTLHSHEEPQRNGVGLLNAYKLGIVGKHLKEKCKENISCFKKEILNEENYDFNLDQLDQNLQGDLKRVFPTCADQEKPSVLKRSNCEEKEEVFTRLRRAVLLNPEESLLKSLSCIYRKSGFSGNAEALDRLALALGSTEDVRAFVRALIENKEKPVPHNIVRLMLEMRGFEEESMRHSELEALPIYNSEDVALLAEALHIGDLFLKREAVRATGYIGDPGMHVLERAFTTSDSYLQRAVVKAAGQMGESVLPFLERTLKEGKNLDPEIRRSIERMIKEFE